MLNNVGRRKTLEKNYITAQIVLFITLLTFFILAMIFAPNITLAGPLKEIGSLKELKQTVEDNIQWYNIPLAFKFVGLGIIMLGFIIRRWATSFFGFIYIILIYFFF